MRKPKRSKLADRREIMAAVLLVAPSIEEAAEILGVSKRTMEREYARPEFQERLRARVNAVADDLVTQTVEKVKALGGAAAEAAGAIIRDADYEPGARASIIRFVLEKSFTLDDRKFFQGLIDKLPEDPAQG